MSTLLSGRICSLLTGLSPLTATTSSAAIASVTGGNTAASTSGGNSGDLQTSLSMFPLTYLMVYKHGTDWLTRFL